MQKNEIEILSEYYQYELSFLRSAGKDFSQKFPKIARRLDFNNNESSDPHVEYLLESFAFLTGKLQKQIDDQFPEIANALLNIIFKPLTLPIPSITFLKYEVDPTKIIQNPGFNIPKLTLFNAYSSSGEKCTFRTTHDLELWPIEIEDVSIVSKEDVTDKSLDAKIYLKIHLQYYGLNGSELPKKLKFYLHGDYLLKNKLYASLFSNNLNPIIIGDKFVYKINQGIKPVGVSDSDVLLDYPDTLHKGFRFLHEYFVYPDKFLGFEIDLQHTNIVGDVQFSENMYIYVPMSFDIGINVSKENLSLTSVPAINLFPKVTEPLVMDYKQVEYRLTPDYRMYNNFEIYSINKLVALDEKNNNENEVHEFFSHYHSDLNVIKNIFWTSKRKKSYISGASGEDVYISFSDIDFNSQTPSERVFYAYTLCTNRHNAEYIPAMCNFEAEISIPVKKIYCVERPSAQISAPKKGDILWKLISLLSLNSLSFAGNGLEKTKEILSLFSDLYESKNFNEIDSIISIQSTISTKRIGKQTWKGFVRGVDIEITFDDNLQNLGLPLSLALSKFLSTFCTINTFSDVVVKNIARNGIIKKWEHNFGYKNYL